MLRGSPSMCIRHTGTPSSAAASSAPSRRSAYTSLIMPAPAATAARITCGREVSMEIGTVVRAASDSIAGSTRRNSSSTETSSAPGRVDSPPTSSMSAPSSTMRTPCATASSTLAWMPPSENESGVRLRMPTTRGRSSDKARPAQSSTGANHSFVMLMSPRRALLPAGSSARAAQLAHVAPVMAQLGDGIADVGQRRVRRFLAHALGDFRRPATRQFLQRGHVEVAIVEIALQPRHLPMHEAPVLADRVAAHRRLAWRHPGAQELHGGLLGHRVVGLRVQHLAPQAGFVMLVDVPAVHGFQSVDFMAYREDRAVGQHVEVLVGNHRGDLENRIVVGVEAGHLQIDPDQVFFVGLAHGISLCDPVYQPCP